MLTYSRSLNVLVVLVLLWLFAGCGTGRTVVCAAGSGNNCSCGACPVSPGPEFLYATSSSNGGQILTFTVDHNSGALSVPSSTPGPTIASEITSAQNRFLYVSSTLPGQIDGFSINQTSGALTQVPGSPFSGSGGSAFFPQSLVAGSALYTISLNGDILGFTIGSNGALTPVTEPTYSAGIGGGLVLGQSNTTPINYFLYATGFLNSSGTVSAFQITDPASGILTPVPGDFTAPAGTLPGSIVFDAVFLTPFLFVGTGGINSIAAFSVDATTGVLTPVSGSPFGSPDLSGPLALNSAQNVLYQSNFPEGTISAYSIASTGVLTPVNGSPFSVGGRPTSFVVTGDNYLYASLLASNTIAGFSISIADGSLTPLPGSPFPAKGAQLLSVVQIPPP